MSENIQSPGTWRGSRAKMWLGVFFITFFGGVLIFSTLFALHPEWDKQDQDTPPNAWFVILLFSYGTYGFMWLASCWHCWSSWHARLRLDQNGVEFQNGQRLRTVAFAGVEKVRWRLIARKVTLTGLGQRATVDFNPYSPKDQREIVAALREALAGREHVGWEKFAANIFPRPRPQRQPVSLPWSERVLLWGGGAILALSAFLAMGLHLTAGRSEWRFIFMATGMNVMAGSAWVILALRELIRYQRTWKVWASLGLALVACGVAVAAMADVEMAQFIRIPMR